MFIWRAKLGSAWQLISPEMNPNAPASNPSAIGLFGDFNVQIFLATLLSALCKLERLVRSVVGVHLY
jgi:hypothetical protein